jgi:hypothetical protein
MSWYAKRLTSVLRGDEHPSYSLAASENQLRALTFVRSESHHRVGQNFTSCTQRAPERGPLLELHGF